jgi:hypothetical protein
MFVAQLTSFREFTDAEYNAGTAARWKLIHFLFLLPPQKILKMFQRLQL